MSPAFRPSAPNVGRFTALILGLIVVLCMTMIGATGYLKYQLDKAEVTLAAPDDALGSDQEMFDRLRRDLGYGGFLGLAQNYALAHDASGFTEMKARIKSANDIVGHLPDKTPAETRHDLTAIVALFTASLQKISAPANEANAEFTSADLAPLYAAMPVLDARVASGSAATRLAAQSEMSFWSMTLTLVSWISLIVAAACAAGIYLTIRDKHSAPMRALAQSIQNMAHGDMRTAIWGTERQDMIGELARAVDIARYHFSHLPDLSLLSDQGPVRMRFEGGARSLFEAMMKALSRDGEQIREQTQAVTASAQQQRETIDLLSDKVSQALQTLLHNGEDGGQQVKQVLHDMAQSVETLKNAHAHAADQINRLVPHIQERAQGMAEIAHITGRQVAQSLQSLTASEIGLKNNVSQVKETLGKLSSTADDLGERLFGAINLLQASGKVFAETTEQIKEKLHVDGESAAPRELSAGSVAALDAAALSPLLDRLDQLAAQMNEIEGKVADGVGGTSPSVALPEIDLAPMLQRMDDMGAQMGDLHEQLAALAGQPAQAPDTGVLEKLVNDFKELADRLAHMQTAMGNQVQESVATLSQTLAEPRPLEPAALSPLAQRLDKIEAQLADVHADLGQKAQTYANDVLRSVEQAVAAEQSALQPMQTRLAEIVQKLTAPLPFDASVLGPLVAQMDGLAAQTAEGQSALERQIQDQANRTIQSVEAAAQTLPQPILDQIAQIDAHMAEGLTHLSQQIDRQQGEISQKLAAPLPFDASVLGPLVAQMDGLAAQTTEGQSALARQIQDQANQTIRSVETAAQTLPQPILDQIAQIDARMVEGLTHLGQQIDRQQGEISQKLDAPLPFDASVLGPLVAQMDSLAAQTAEGQSTLERQIQDQANQTIHSVETAAQTLPQPILDQIAQIDARMVEGLTHLDQQIDRQQGEISQKLDAPLPFDASALEPLASQLDRMAAQLADWQPGMAEMRAEMGRQIKQAQNEIEEKLAAPLPFDASVLGPLVAQMDGLVAQTAEGQSTLERQIQDQANQTIQSVEAAAQTLPQPILDQIAQIDAHMAEGLTHLSQQIDRQQGEISQKLAAPLPFDASVLGPLVAQMDGLAAQTTEGQSALARQIQDQANQTIRSVETAAQTLPQPILDQIAQIDARMVEGLTHLDQQIDRQQGEISQKLDAPLPFDASVLGPLVAQMDSLAAQTAEGQSTLERQIQDQANQTIHSVETAAQTLPQPILDQIAQIDARMVEGLAHLGQQIDRQQGEISQKLDAPLPFDASVLGPLVAQMDGLAAQTAGGQSALARQIQDHTRETLHSVETAEQNILRPVIAQLDTVAAQMAQTQTHVDQSLQRQSDIVIRAAETPVSLTEDAWTPLIDRLNQLTQSVSALRAGVDARLQEQTNALTQSLAAPVALDPHTLAPLAQGLDQLSSQLDEARASLAAEMHTHSAATDEAMAGTLAALRDGQDESGKAADEIRATLRSLGDEMERQQLFIQKTGESHAEQMGRIAEESATRAAQSRDALLAAIRDIKEGVETTAESLAETLHRDTGTELARLIDRLSPQLSDIEKTVAGQTAVIVEQTTASSLYVRNMLMEVSLKLTEIGQSLPADMQQMLEAQLRHLTGQIENSRALLDKTMKEHLVARMGSFETLLVSTKSMAEMAKDASERPQKVTYAMSGELQKQLHDQWFQMAAQIEATRASLADGIAHQVEQLEARLAGRKTVGLDLPSDNGMAAQRQIEQQTQILSELVSTLAVLDSHMQQIKSEMRTRA